MLPKLRSQKRLKPFPGRGFMSRVTVLAIAGLLLSAAGAHATTVAYSGDNSTVIVTGGDNAAHDIQFRLSADASADEILDTAGFTTYPEDCTVVVNVPTTWISRPGHDNVKVDLGAGNDDVTFDGPNFDCFNGIRPEPRRRH